MGIILWKFTVKIAKTPLFDHATHSQVITTRFWQEHTQIHTKIPGFAEQLPCGLAVSVLFGCLTFLPI